MVCLGAMAVILLAGLLICSIPHFIQSLKSDFPQRYAYAFFHREGPAIWGTSTNNRIEEIGMTVLPLWS